jgi:hypothetical protein
LCNFDTVEFLFSNSPVNYCVDINPFRTKIYKNGNGETILSFYVDDIGEWRYISKVKPENIISITSAYNDRAGHGYVVFYIINK